MDGYQETDGLRSGALEYRDVWQEPEIADIPVENGIASDGSLSGQSVAKVRLDTEDTELQVLLGDQEEVKISVTEDNTLTAPVARGNWWEL